jgi:hypothetical protein
MNVDDWHNLYGDGWKGEIVEDAFKHPAKFSRALVRRIYDHCRAEGWLAAGDAVCDPFGGVALGALDAMRLGLHWTGVELEPRFAELGGANIAAWNARYSARLPRWGTARLLTGDSRQFAAVVERAALCVSSPPYADGARQEGNDRHPERMEGTAHAPARYDLAVSSPPFENSLDRGVVPAVERRKFAREAGISNAEHISPIDMERVGQRTQPDYGDTPGQLSRMHPNGFEAAISSPPWDTGAPPVAPERVRTSHSPKDHGAAGPAYVAMPVPDDFWMAANVIVEQVYRVLTPGGHVCWVVKDFVRNKSIVPFSEMWRALCEANGFDTVHQHRALVVEDRGTQLATDGQHKAHITERKSFFRRLAEKNGSPRIDWETVWCMVKPA